MSKTTVREAASKLDVRQFKLTNGEDIVACVVTETTRRFELEGPLQIYERMGEDGLSVGFRPWLSMGIDTNATILKNNIVANTKIDLDNKESYLSSIVSIATSQTESIPTNQYVH